MDNSRQFDVVVAGLAVADIIGRPIDLQKMPRPGGLKLIDGVTLTTGGNVSNVGIDLVKLGFRVAAITRVGNDALGQFVAQRYQAHGIDSRGIIVDPKVQTSATIVCVADDGERSFLFTRGCMANFRVNDVLGHLPLIQKADLFAFGYLGLLPEAEKDFRRLFKTIKEKTPAKILLDTGGTPRASVKSLKSFLPFVDYFIPSFEEAVQLTGRDTPEEITHFLTKIGAQGVVGVKMGSKGSYIVHENKRRYIKPRRVKKVIDATGAGDAFVAGFLAAIVKGYDPFKAAHVGSAVAASCVTAVGASTAIEKFERYAG